MILVRFARIEISACAAHAGKRDNGGSTFSREKVSVATDTFCLRQMQLKEPGAKVSVATDTLLSQKEFEDIVFVGCELSGYDSLVGIMRLAEHVAARRWRTNNGTVAGL